MELQAMIDAYLAGGATLRRAVTGMTREQLVAHPVPGKWSTLEVVCHIADFEPVYADRMKRVIAEDQPLFLSADEARFAASLNYLGRELDEELALIDLTRHQMASILRTVPPETLARTGVYRRHEVADEPRNLERLLTLITNHIPHHVKFIVEKRRALGLPT
ncbi:MAG TPA: DinB family protein [Isosphaeraceae bacterium]|jgi:uncharacterized damage-inducible protein DinB|nr:DinB family protein [Isosphaeraceae bacterium]